MGKKKIEAVVLDMDGVIIDTEKMYLECWVQIGKQRDLPGIEIPARLSIGVNWEGTRQLMFDYLGTDIPLNKMVEEFNQMAAEELKNARVDLKPGIRELLQYLSENHYKIGLASSSDREVVETILRQYELIDYFMSLTCGDEVHHSKPDPEIYQIACRNLAVSPENAIAIEDSFNGIRSAYQAGMMPIMVPDLIAPDEEMQEKTVTIVDNLIEIIEYLKNI